MTLINISVKDLDGQVHEIQGREGDSLMEALRQQEWGVAAVCGGLCSCGTCHVYMETERQNKVKPADADEQEQLDEYENTKAKARLSCQLPLQPSHDGIKLTIAPDE